MTVLDSRRANNIQIAIKKLPAARHIRTAIMNMDQTFFNKEMVEVQQINNILFPRTTSYSLTMDVPYSI